MDHLCYLCLVFIMIIRLFIDALWSPEGKGDGIRRRSPWILEVHNVHCLHGRAFIALKYFWAPGI